MFLLVTLILAAVFPPSGSISGSLSTVAAVGVAVQFFISGLRLSTSAAVEGVRAWKLHLLISGCTFLIFPLRGLGVAAGTSWFLAPELVAGLLFLGVLPTAVQTAITFTGIERGNVAAAVCAASISNLRGIVLTPLLVALFLGSYGGMNLSSALKIVVQILVPFVLGQLLNRRLGGWAMRHALPLKIVDRGAILLVVYTAFGSAVANGLWQKLPPVQLAVVVAMQLIVCAALARRLALRPPHRPQVPAELG